MASVKKPFFIVNPKSYLYGDDAVKLAKIADEIAAEKHLDCLFTGQLIDLPRIKAATSHLIITAQHMDPLLPGRGMGHVLPEALKAADVEAVVLNHAENPLEIGVLDKTITRAKAVGLMTVVCSDTPSESRAIASLSTGADVKKVLALGADGTGGTSGIINAPDWRAKLMEMMGAMAAYKEAQLA